MIIEDQLDARWARPATSFTPRCVKPHSEVDESMAPRHLKSPRSLSGRSSHLTLVTKWPWSWSWMTYSHPFAQCQSALPFWETAIHGQGHLCGQRSRSILTLKIQGQGLGPGQTWWSHLKPKVQSIYLLFFSWQSDQFWLRYSKFHIWPWKCKVKVIVKVKPDGHIWGIEFNWYVCFSFRGNPTNFGWDWANSIFDLGNSRSKSWPKSNPMVAFEA